MAKYIDVTEAIKTAESMRKIAKADGENVEAFEMLIQFLKDQDVVFQTPDEGIKISNVVQNGSGSNSITISDKEVGKNPRTAYVNDGSEDCDFVPCITEEEADKLFGKANNKITGRYGNMYVATAVEGDKITGTYGDKSVRISPPPQCPECHSIFFDSSNGICIRCSRSKLSK